MHLSMGIALFSMEQRWKRKLPNTMPKYFENLRSHENKIKNKKQHQKQGKKKRKQNRNFTVFAAEHMPIEVHCQFAAKRLYSPTTKMIQLLLNYIIIYQWS